MKKRVSVMCFVMCFAVTFSACGGKTKDEASTELLQEGTETGVQSNIADAPMMVANAGDLNILDDKYRTYYEVFLYSYYDSNQDGIGDIQGLIDKLDYINDGDDKTDTDLGCNGIWLMPVMPSATYHKYDVTDYKDIDPEYGTLDDFKQLIEASHERGMNVIIDFVMNHTSSGHPWFQEACTYLEQLSDGEQPDVSECPYVDYYNFSDKKENEAYYQAGTSNWYYEGKFWSGMPDLNLANEAVRQEFLDITSFWLDLGVDGFRLDAVKEYYSDKTDDNVEVLSWFNDMVKEQKTDAYIVGEAWTDMETYSKYYASGIDSLFDFSFADSSGIIANSVKHASGYTAKSYASAVGKLSDTFGAYNENYIDAPFYTNHDLGRGAGYYSGDNSEAQTKTAAAMNLMMSGNCFVYYGEELGMKGSGKDENKRAPMLWSTDKAAEGMCRGPEGMENIKMKYGSLQEQQDDASSIYNYYKQAIRIRNMYPQIARGAAENLKDLSNENIAAVAKTYEDTTLILLFNISDQEQRVNLSSTELGSEAKLGGMLLTGEDAVQVEKGSVTMPAYSVAVMTEK